MLHNSQIKLYEVQDRIYKMIAIKHVGFMRLN